MKKNTSKRSIALLVLLALTYVSRAQPLSEKLAKTAMELWPDTSKTAFTKPAYNQGFLLEGMASVWKRTADVEYYRYILHSIDRLVDKDGKITNYKQEDLNLNNIKIGSALLLLYRVTGQEKYYKALNQLNGQLKNQPKKFDLMQPEDFYGSQVFATEYAAVFDKPAAFDDLAKQFISTQDLTFKTGFEGNKIGYYGMALVDVLEYFPENHPQRKVLLTILNRFAAVVQQNQNPKTGIWPRFINKANGTGASANGVFVYTLTKSTRLGYLPEKYKSVAKKGFAGMLKYEAVGNMTNPEVAGISILAANEMELAEIPQSGKGQTVMLDSYFNNEFMTDVTGRSISFHYKWNEMDNNGFSFFKNAFNYHGVKTATLNDAPTYANLKGSNIYIIVDPDTQKETAKPNYVNEQDATEVAAWVKAGGVLVLLANDVGNCDLQHFNILSKKFGIEFNEDSRNKVTGTQFATGNFQMPDTDPIFKTGKKVHIKEISTLKITPPAVASFTDGKDVIIATAKYGKGSVFAVGDPWFYNEYVDGRKLPANYENFKACNDLVNWLVKQVPAK